MPNGQYSQFPIMNLHNFYSLQLLTVPSSYLSHSRFLLSLHFSRFKLIFTFSMFYHVLSFFSIFFFIFHWYWPLYTICSNNITHIKFFSVLVANVIINSTLFLVCAVSILYLFIVFGYFHYWHPIRICAMNVGESTPKRQTKKTVQNKKLCVSFTRCHKYRSISQNQSK